MQGIAVVCAVMSGIALEQLGGFQLSYMEGTFHFLSAYLNSLFLVDFKLLVYHQISKLNIRSSYVSGPSPAVGLLGHMSWTRTHTTQHCQVLCEVDMQQ